MVITYADLPPWQRALLRLICDRAFAAGSGQPPLLECEDAALMELFRAVYIDWWQWTAEIEPELPIPAWLAALQQEKEA